MSRIIVKNLPKKITEDKLREIFGEKGLLTDVQLKYTSDGKFRQFAFLGYQNEEEAKQAIKHFNNTCIKTSRIVVESCSDLGDNKKPKAWSKYAPESSAYKKLHPEKLIKIDDAEPKKKSEKIIKNAERSANKKAELLKKYKDDPLFEDFLQVHGAKEIELLNTLKMQNDEQSEIEEDATNSEAIEEEEDHTEEKKEKVANLAVSDKEYMQILKNKSKPGRKQKEMKDIKLFNLVLRRLPLAFKKKDIKAFFNPNKPFSIRIPRNVKGIAYVGFKTEKAMRKALTKDRSIMAGKSVSVREYENTYEQHNEEQPQGGQDPTKCKWKRQEDNLKTEEEIGESGRVFVRNLAYITTEDDLENLFSKYGPITEVKLPVDSVTRVSKGFAIVTFLMPEHAVKAFSELDGSILHGRMLHLLPGMTKDAPENETSGETTNFKKAKEMKQKSQAGSSHNWNSLFLGPNAVAEVMAETNKVSKQDILNPHSDSEAAVRLALGETKIVLETRKYLEAEGVVLDAFNGPTTKRSKTIILVKNLPANTDIKEIRNVFEPHGVIGRIILPPSGLTAIVEFVEPSEARKAFLRLALTKFKSTLLYLEWAPENSVSRRTTLASSKKEMASSSNGESNADQCVTSETKEKEVIEEAEEEGEPENDTTLFVKNLNFRTTDEELRKHFECCGRIFYATVATKKDKEHPDRKLSMGYGFVRFFQKSNTDKALKELQGSTLDGKSLELKRSERTLANEVQANRKVAKKTKQNGTKLMVRNVPFQATKKELFQLFGAFGEIKALRLPMKMTVGDKQHRGFCFVDYFIASQAKDAFEALSQSSHLYGRRLILEWASNDEDVDEIRKRTASHFHNEDAPKSKKSVFSMD